MKCILPLILALCLPVLAAPALAAEAPAQGTELTNVDSGDCFYAQVQSAVKEKVTTGTSATEFAPRPALHPGPDHHLSVEGRRLPACL